MNMVKITILVLFLLGIGVTTFADDPKAASIGSAVATGVAGVADIGLGTVLIDNPVTEVQGWLHIGTGITSVGASVANGVQAATYDGDSSQLAGSTNGARGTGDTPPLSQEEANRLQDQANQLREQAASRGFDLDRLIQNPEEFLTEEQLEQVRSGESTQMALDHLSNSSEEELKNKGLDSDKLSQMRDLASQGEGEPFKVDLPELRSEGDSLSSFDLNGFFNRQQPQQPRRQTPDATLPLSPVGDASLFQRVSHKIQQKI